MTLGKTLHFLMFPGQRVHHALPSAPNIFSAPYYHLRFIAYVLLVCESPLQGFSPQSSRIERRLPSSLSQPRVGDFITWITIDHTVLVSLLPWERSWWSPQPQGQLHEDRARSVLFTSLYLGEVTPQILMEWMMPPAGDWGGGSSFSPGSGMS